MREDTPLPAALQRRVLPSEEQQMHSLLTLGDFSLDLSQNQSQNGPFSHSLFLPPPSSPYMLLKMSVKGDPSPLHFALREESIEKAGRDTLDRLNGTHLLKIARAPTVVAFPQSD